MGSASTGKPLKQGLEKQGDHTEVMYQGQAGLL